MGACLSSGKVEEEPRPKPWQQASIRTAPAQNLTQEMHTQPSRTAHKAQEAEPLPSSQSESGNERGGKNNSSPTHDTANANAPKETRSQDNVSQQQLSSTLADWQEQQESRSTQLKEQILLQSQEITMLRDQVIDLQAFRQQHQRQQQRAAYIKSKLLPRFEALEHGNNVSSDCCAAAMACCLAIQELKADLKVEGQIISKQFEALLRTHKSGSILAKPSPLARASSTVHSEVLINNALHRL